MRLPREVSIFGKPYQLASIDNPLAPYGVYVQGEQLICNLHRNTPAKTHEKLERFFKTTAAQFITVKLKFWSVRMGITYNRVSFRKQSSRWGSCSSLGNLNFNWLLVHHPPEIIEYVIIHELAHRQQMNHSAAFWNIVARYDPSYKSHKGWLKRVRPH